MNAERLAQVSFAKIINSRQQKGGTRLHKHLLVLRILQKVREVFTVPQRLTTKQKDTVEESTEDQCDRMDISEDVDNNKLKSTMIEFDDQIDSKSADSADDDDNTMELDSPISSSAEIAAQLGSKNDSVTTTPSCSSTTCTIVFSPTFSTSLCCSSAKVVVSVQRGKRLHPAAISCQVATKRVRPDTQLHPVLRADRNELLKTNSSPPNICLIPSLLIRTATDPQNRVGLSLSLTSVARLPCGTHLASTSDSQRPKSAILTHS